MSFKPADHSTVSPYLIVNGAAATIEFVTSVLGAREVRRFADDRGAIGLAREDRRVDVGNRGAREGRRAGSPSGGTIS
jgi:catechol 2,3-dioxygenase-like lactoylglutathione lyase family enzyme